MRRDRATSSSAPPARCPASCTSSGGSRTRTATTLRTATPASATRLRPHSVGLVGVGSRPRPIDEVTAPLDAAKTIDTTVVVAVEADRSAAVPRYDTWWDVPVAEVAAVEAVSEARLEYDRAVRRRRCTL